MAKSERAKGTRAAIIIYVDITCPNCKGSIPCAGNISIKELSEIECIYCGHKFALVGRVREKLSKGLKLLTAELRKVCKTLST